MINAYNTFRKIVRDIIEFAVNLKSEIKDATREYSNFKGTRKDFIDWYVFEWTSPTINKSILQMYIDANKDMSSELKTKILNLRDSRYGIFEIKKITPDGVLLFDLYKKKEYFVNERRATPKMREGYIVEGRLLPWEDMYFFSDMIFLYPLKVENFENNKILCKDFSKIEKLLDRASSLIYKDRCETALKIIDKVLQLDKGNEDAHLLKGEAYFRLYRFVDADEWFDKCISLNPNNDSAYLHKAFIPFFLGKYQLALNHIEKALSINPNNYESIIFKAQILYQLGREDYKKWVEKASDIDAQRTKKIMDRFWIYEKRDIITVGG